MKIALVVQGRFHALDLGSALLARGHDVKVFTNYPRWAVKRFGFPVEHARTCPGHGVAARVGDRWSKATGLSVDRWLHSAFGKWAAEQLGRERWDVIHSWSGISEEIFEGRSTDAGLTVLMRGSAHIRHQDRILEAEERRTGARIERPAAWMIEREEREYDLADRILVLSAFAHQSFIAEGVDPSKLDILSLGASAEMFRPSEDVIDARCRRILSGEPLRILYTGALSLQKGMWDLAAIIRELASDFRFRLIGPAVSETRALIDGLSGISEVIPKQPQRELMRWYSDADLFLFPTLQDGFALVLAQAQANGLPLLTTPNCSGPDLLNHGEGGWVLPIRRPDAFVECLRWCHEHRSELAEMVWKVYRTARTRTWGDVARDFETICVKHFRRTPVNA